MKILIVEDELKTLHGVAGLIMEIPGDYEVVGMARSGEKGIELAREMNPDIIITDIRMGGMSGLEMIKELNSSKVQSRYIILSGYAEFQYAREAITLGSMDYLLKPITKELLEESLKKVKNAIEEEALKIQTSTMDGDVILERALFMSGFAESKFEQELRKRLEGKNLNYLLLLRGENRIVQSDMEAVLQEIRGVMPSLHIWSCKENGNKENYILIQELEREALPILDEMVRKCRQHINPYMVFVGSYFQDVREIQECRERMQDMSNWNLTIVNPAVITEDKIKEVTTQKFSYPSDLERDIIACINEGKIQEIENHLTAFLEYLRKKTYAYGDLREALICMTAAILYAIRKASYGLYENISSLNILEWVKDILFLENYPRIIMNVMLQYEQYSKKLKSGNHPIINKVLQILEKEYQNELQLEDMAQRMNVTPEYLSSLFMKELGIKYTTYRAQIRIDVAKRLLQEGKLKIYEVAEESGFPDVKYFTKVFKKYTGTSPGEYVRNLV
ncbi:response regulator [Kineothrix sp. MB12-C1]|uniref:response regulator n=1 Tax=Kineothrix sp. MB12-C1 TaxID=3070215 RepID=UPI0027D2739B|nr:response regulator [Kineothrix sp. MB12-C1]WMC91442.1 response regulator [Kineothrix sp. MB12-C1]